MTGKACRAAGNSATGEKNTRSATRQTGGIPYREDRRQQQILPGPGQV